MQEGSPYISLWKNYSKKEKNEKKEMEKSFQVDMSIYYMQFVANTRVMFCQLFFILRMQKFGKGADVHPSLTISVFG